MDEHKLGQMDFLLNTDSCYSCEPGYKQIRITLTAYLTALLGTLFGIGIFFLTEKSLFGCLFSIAIVAVNLLLVIGIVTESPALLLPYLISGAIFLACWAWHGIGPLIAYTKTVSKPKEAKQIGEDAEQQQKPPAAPATIVQQTPLPQKSNANTDEETQMRLRRKLQRNRTTITREQIDEMERAFQISHTPDVHVLANKINLSETIVKVWFQNRRGKFQRENRIFNQNNNNSLHNNHQTQKRDVDDELGTIASGGGSDGTTDGGKPSSMSAGSSSAPSTVSESSTVSSSSAASVSSCPTMTVTTAGQQQQHQQQHLEQPTKRDGMTQTGEGNALMMPNSVSSTSSSVPQHAND